MSLEFLNLSLAALALISVMMVVVWLISVRINNAGIVDVAWSWGFSPVALLYAALGHGFWLRKTLIATMVVLWSLRLGTYLYFRVMGHHPVEDARYNQLRQEWGDAANRNMFWFFQFQGVLLVALTFPFLFSCLNPQPNLGMVEWLGAAIWCLGLIGESLADWQLKQFKANPDNRGHVCQVGLWRFSRHPNYFFEWTIWVAYFLFALGSPYGFLSIHSPLFMLYFLLKVTGIPALEAAALKSKGEEYRQYQRTTSSFIPWVRKS